MATDAERIQNVFLSANKVILENYRRSGNLSLAVKTSIWTSRLQKQHFCIGGSKDEECILNDRIYFLNQILRMRSSRIKICGELLDTEDLLWPLSDLTGALYRQSWAVFIAFTQLLLDVKRRWDHTHTTQPQRAAVYGVRTNHRFRRS